MPNFFKELKKRKVVKSIISYGVIVFILFQLVEILFPIFELPIWASKFVILLLLLGFPIVFFISWFFDFSRDEMKVNKSNSSSLNKIIFFVLILFVIGGYFIINTDQKSDNDGEKFIAILPFDNFSENPNDTFLSDGMTEDITMQLAKVKEMNVISRTSVMKYKNEAKNIKNIAQELGASFILEGSVRRINNNIRVVTQLIDADTDKHIWAESFDTKIEEILEVPKKIAEDVAINILGKLSNKEKESINKSSTENQKAHNHYIIAKNLIGSSFNATDPRILYQAIDELKKSIEYDSNYVDAFTLIAEAHLSLYWQSFDRTKSRLNQAKQVLDMVKDKGLKNPSYHKTLGEYYYRGFRNYALALESFNIALELTPNFPEALIQKAYIYRRLGKYKDAIMLFNKARALDPNNYTIYSQLAYTKLRLGDFDGMNKIIDNGLPKSLNNLSLRITKVHAELERSGNIGDAVKSIDELFELTSNKTLLPLLFDYYLSLEDYSNAMKIAKMIPSEFSQNRQLYTYKPISRNMAYGILNYKLGKINQSKNFLKLEIDNLKNELDQSPGNYELHRRLGLAYAYSNDKKSAIYELKLAASMLSIEVDALYGPFYLFSLAEAYHLFGNRADSKELLDILNDLDAGILNYDYKESWRWNN
tara:strand:+ start:38 stop:1981 length:1944 start_codon:yes stop_codon:yes gene_type:complete